MVNMRNDVGAGVVRAALRYEPATGQFFWAHRSDRDFSWNNKHAGKRAGCLNAQGYEIILFNRKPYMAHRLAWLCVTGSWPVDELDHINLNRADNRIKNLRPATRSQNSHNRALQGNNTSGFRGVCFSKAHQKWSASIKLNSRRYHLGYANTAEEAHALYVAASLDKHGKFSNLPKRAA
jgi:hypothetical protein